MYTSPFMNIHHIFGLRLLSELQLDLMFLKGVELYTGLSLVFESKGEVVVVGLEGVGSDWPLRTKRGCSSEIRRV